MQQSVYAIRVSEGIQAFKVRSGVADGGQGSSLHSLWQTHSNSKPNKYYYRNCYGRHNQVLA